MQLCAHFSVLFIPNYNIKTEGTISLHSHYISALAWLKQPHSIAVNLFISWAFIYIGPQHTVEFMGLTRVLGAKGSSEIYEIDHNTKTGLYLC